MNLEEKLAFLDDEYLSKYDRQGNSFVIDEQKPLGYTKKTETYMVGAGEALEDVAVSEGLSVKKVIHVDSTGTDENGKPRGTVEFNENIVRRIYESK